MSAADPVQYLTVCQYVQVISKVFRCTVAAVPRATGAGDWFSQVNRPTRGTTNYEGDGGLHALTDVFALIEGAGIYALS